MKTLFAILCVAMLAVAGSAYAQTTTPADTSATAAATGSYPAGTSFNGVPLQGFHIGNGAVIAGDGTAADGSLAIALLAIPTPLGQQVITVSANISSGTRVAGGVAMLSGTATLDMGNGTPPLTGVPVVVTISANPDGTGTVGIVLNSITLPTSPIDDGTLTVEDMPT